MTKEHKSDCCGASVKVVEGTNYWECRVCGNSCNDTFYSEDTPTPNTSEQELLKLLDDPRTGLRDSSDTNKTRYAILALFSSKDEAIRADQRTKDAEEWMGCIGDEAREMNGWNIPDVICTDCDKSLVWNACRSEILDNARSKGLIK